MRLSTIFYVFLFCFAAFSSFAQKDSTKTSGKPKREYIYQTFKDTRVINTQSVETLRKNTMDVRIAHRFGDIAGAAGGFKTFFGFENAADISLGVDYGILNNLMVGIHRSKGAAQYRQLLNGYVKYKLLHQTANNKIPFSMSVVGMATVSTMRRDTNNTQSLAYFPKAAHRFSYSLELHMARKFGNVFSLQLSPTFVWRNYVPKGDENALFSLGVCMKVQMSRMIGLIIDGNFPFSASRFNDPNGYHTRMSLGLGVEIETNGHVFQVNITNSAGVYATDYIPYTTANWAKGQFRLGFTISRIFRF